MTRRVTLPVLAAVLVTAVLAGCGSGPSSGAARAVDSTTPIDLAAVDACALLTPARAEAVTGRPMTVPPTPSLPAGVTLDDTSSCEYFPVEEPNGSETSIQVFALAAPDSPLGTYEAALAVFGSQCDEVSQPPAAAAVEQCAYQPVDVGGSARGYLLYPGASRGGSRGGSDTSSAPGAGLQLNWFAGGLAFTLMTSTDAATSVDPLSSVADQIAHDLV